ncbi:MAG TPA: patatin-like phospholipase family protein [Dongiaceae bacterium]|nr:patatin-like phospholipase family protein [Dongiaceae bacterium]
MVNPWERRLFFALIATIVWAAAMQIEAIGIVFANFQRPHTCSYFAGHPIVDAELASGAACFVAVVQQGNPNHQIQNILALQTNTRMDFVFIGLYLWVLVCFAKLDWRWWSPVVIVLASAAALFDVLENWRILACIRELFASGQVQSMLPRSFSLVKWIAFGSALVVLGGGRWFCESRFWRWILPVIMVLAGAITVVGVKSDTVMEYAGYGFAALILVSVARYWPWSYDETFAGIEYAYLMRFQLVSAAILAAAFPAGYRVAPNFFSGLFDGIGFPSFVFIVWAAFQLAWTIMVTVRLVFVYGPDRFGRVKMNEEPAATSGKSSGPRSVGPVTVAAFGTLALPLVTVLYVGTAGISGGVKFAAIVLGLGLAVAILFLTALLHFMIEEDSRCSAEMIFPSFGFLKHAKGTLKDLRLWRRTSEMLSRLPRDLWPGVLDEAGRLRSGHEMAAIALLIFLVFYGAVGLAFSPAYTKPENQPAAMFFLLVMVTVFTWLLPGAAFFLDRTRLPVFTTLLVVSLLTGFAGTDHVYVVKERNTANEITLSPPQVVRAWERGKRRRGSGTVVVVATAGGGIRAAAWTAEVITELQAQCPKVSDSLLLVSSVSGGSVGAMHVVGPYYGEGEYPADLEAIRENAKRSSLSAVGWGMAYPDLARTSPLVGIAVPEWLDRGWSLENAWATAWKKMRQEAPRMSDWRADVSKGIRPAVIFNATVSENGDRFLVASTDTVSDGTKRFFEMYPSGDVAVTTAARLSATFPYVSPLARASVDAKGFHIGDGGYYDNSGLLSAVEWLEQASEALGKWNVLLILIDAKPGDEPGGGKWTWQKQIVGPVETLLNVRTSSQQLRDSIELKMAEEYLTSHGVPQMKTVKFLFGSNSPVPLSWHLTPSQVSEIHNAWETGDNLDAAQDVYQQLGCPTEPATSSGPATQQ